MAYKCKSCGYRFKASDSDLCPECFTARDDISCTDIGGETFHNHFKDSAGGDDFIARQMREESRLSGDELLEQISGITDSVKRGISRNEIPPNTYQRTPQPQRVPYTPQNKPFVPQFSQQVQQASNNVGGTDHTQKKGVSCIIAFIIAAAILTNFSAIKRIFRHFEEFFEADRELQLSEERDAEPTTVTASPAPEVTSPEVNKAEGYVEDMFFYSEYPGLDVPAAEFSAERIDSVPSLSESVWYTVKCSIVLPEGGSRAEDITLFGYIGSSEYFSWQMKNEFGLGDKLYGVPLTFARCDRYEVHISYTDGSGEKSTLVLEPDLNAVVDEHSSGKASDMTGEPGSYKYSYDYTETAFDTSLTDMNGSGYRLRLAGEPLDYESSGAKGTLSLEDEALPTDDMKLCKVMVVTDDGKSPGDAEYYQTYIVGFDAKGTVSYVYNVNGSHEVPVSSRVQNYELGVIIVDEGGYAKELHYRFSSADLYATKS